MCLNLNRKYLFLVVLEKIFFSFRPMCFSMEDVDYFCDKFEMIIQEMKKK